MMGVGEVYFDKSSKVHFSCARMAYLLDVN